MKTLLLVLLASGMVYATEPNEIDSLRSENVKLKRQLSELKSENARLRLIVNHSDPNKPVRKSSVGGIRPTVIEKAFYPPLSIGQVACLGNSIDYKRVKIKDNAVLGRMSLRSKPYIEKKESGVLVEKVDHLEPVDVIVNGLTTENIEKNQRPKNTDIYKIIGTEQFMGNKCYVLSPYVSK